MVEKQITLDDLSPELLQQLEEKWREQQSSVVERQKKELAAEILKKVGKKDANARKMSKPVSAGFDIPQLKPLTKSPVYALVYDNERATLRTKGPSNGAIYLSYLLKDGEAQKTVPVTRGRHQETITRSRTTGGKPQRDIVINIGLNFLSYEAVNGLQDSVLFKELVAGGAITVYAGLPLDSRDCRCSPIDFLPADAALLCSKINSMAMIQEFESEVKEFFSVKHKEVVDQFYTKKAALEAHIKRCREQMGEA